MSGLFSPPGGSGGVPVLSGNSIAVTNASGVLTTSANLAVDSATGAVTIRDQSGQNQTIFAASIIGHRVHISDGTSALPLGTPIPTLKVIKTEQLTRAAVEAQGSVGTDGSDQVPAILGASFGTASTEIQTVGVMGWAQSASTSAVAGHDACGGYFGGKMTGTGVGIGVFAAASVTNDTGMADAVEAHVDNFGTVDANWITTGFSRLTGIWINAGGNAGSAAAFVVGNAFGQQFDVGIAFSSQTNNAKIGGTKSADVRSESTATASYVIGGSHTYGVDMHTATFSGAGVLLPNNKSVASKNAAANADVALISLDGSNKMSLYNGLTTLDASGNLVVTAAITLGGIINMVNNTGISQKDSAGTLIPVTSFATDNFLRIGTASAPATNGGTIFLAKGVECFRVGSDATFRPVNTMIWQADNTYDVGQTGAARPRDVYIARNNNVGGHILATQTTGTVAAAAGANAGTTPPAPVLTACTDVKGSITFGTGTTPAAGAQVTVTFGLAYGAAPVVHVQEQNSATKALGAYVSAVSTTGFTVSTTSAPTGSQANTVYSIGYAVIG